MKTNLAIRSTLALALTVAVWSPIRAASEPPDPQGPAAEAQMVARCQEMKEQKQKLKDAVKAQDAELAQQVEEMNRAPKSQRVSRMAAVITRMAEQRIAMDARKAEMEEKMMRHMMQHMQMGKESMSHCPMMGGMDAKTMDSHHAPQ